MGEKVSNFEKRYELNGFNIIVKGELKRGEYGEYYTEISYTLPHETITRKTTLYLNGPGKSKLEKKIISHLYMQMKK